jgi:hypothetical protein
VTTGLEAAAPADAAAVAAGVGDVSPPDARAVDDANGFAMYLMRCDSDDDEEDGSVCCLLMKAKLRLKSS